MRHPLLLQPLLGDLDLDAADDLSDFYDNRSTDRTLSFDVAGKAT